MCIVTILVIREEAISSISLANFAAIAHLLVKNYTNRNRWSQKSSFFKSMHLSKLILWHSSTHSSFRQDWIPPLSLSITDPSCSMSVMMSRCSLCENIVCSCFLSIIYLWVLLKIGEFFISFLLLKILLTLSFFKFMIF